MPPTSRTITSATARKISSHMSKAMDRFLDSTGHDYAAWLDSRGYPTDFSPLHAMAKVGLAECMEDLITRGSDLSVADAQGRVPISYVAEEEFANVVSLH